jgi:hypothetical protein
MIDLFVNAKDVITKVTFDIVHKKLYLQFTAVYAALHCDALGVRLPILTPLTKSGISLKQLQMYLTERKLIPMREHYKYKLFVFMAVKGFKTQQKFFLRPSLEHSETQNSTAKSAQLVRIPSDN